MERLACVPSSSCLSLRPSLTGLPPGDVCFGPQTSGENHGFRRARGRGDAYCRGRRRVRITPWGVVGGRRAAPEGARGTARPALTDPQQKSIPRREGARGPGPPGARDGVRAAVSHRVTSSAQIRTSARCWSTAWPYEPCARPESPTSVSPTRTGRPWPASEEPEDLEAAAFYDLLLNWLFALNRLFADPVPTGQYPDGLGELMPGDVEIDLKVISEPVDWYGINYYAPTGVGAPRGSEIEGYPVTGFGWPVVPEARDTQAVPPTELVPAAAAPDRPGPTDDRRTAGGQQHRARQTVPRA